MEEKNIFQRIAAVMQDVRYLAKDDKVEYGNTKYKAVSEEKVTSTVRESLINHGIVIVPVEQLHRREGTLTTVDVVYRVQNIDNPEDYIMATSSGTGADTQDKGVGKAMTYAYKYLLLRTFAIPTGEDPDKISSAELDDKQKKSGDEPIDEVKQAVLLKALEEVGGDIDSTLAYLRKKYPAKPPQAIHDITVAMFTSYMKAIERRKQGRVKS